MNSSTGWIVDAVRTPRGRGNDKGALHPLRPLELLAQTLRALERRQPFEAGALADLVIGCVTQTAEQGANVGKLAAIAAGWPDTVPAMTVNRYCASGLSAVGYAALRACADDGFAIGGGVEMMARVPMASDRGPLTHDVELQRVAALLPIGIAADAIATLHGFSREQCDAWALRSQRRAAAAQDGGRFRSLCSVTAPDGSPLLERDETLRRSTSAESLSTLPPAFAEMAAKSGVGRLLAARLGLVRLEHVHHAGNSPATADGASAVLVASEPALLRAGWRPRARIVAMAEVAIDRTLALTGAVDATRRVLERAGIGVDAVDLFEVNESFAAPMLHFCRELGLDEDRVNVNGGAIALGHAMGSTGSALLGTLLDELELRGARRGVVALCGAAGLASAMLVERS
jgi:acetyl-CoA C-acetyltransferase